MKSTVIGLNLRTLSKTIRLMAKYSEEIKILVINDCLILQSVNFDSTLFCQVTFEKNFFTSFQNDDDFECKVDIRSIGFVFRVVSLDKMTNVCKIKMDNSMDHIIFHMECPNRIRRNYRIPIMKNNDHQRCPVPLSQQLSNPTLRCSAYTMNESIKPFPLSTDEIIIWTFRDYLGFKTYFETNYDGPMTEFCVSSTYFRMMDSVYNYTNDMSIALNLKELRSFLDFAMHRNQVISAYLQSDGKPIEFMFKNSDGCSASIMMGTIDLKNDSQPAIPPAFRITHQITDDSSSGSVLQNVSLDSRAISHEIPMNHSSMGKESIHHDVSTFIGNVTNSSLPNQSIGQQQLSLLDQREQSMDTASDHPIRDEFIPQNIDQNDDDNNIDISKEIYQEIENSDNELTSSQSHFVFGDQSFEPYATLAPYSEYEVTE
ncbi:uncharacterized protein LOC124489994 [Dermatophagoides farinae]|nr:uncharacterized protein LOC124489994 isoform X1 [Dermatophagoides farinae]